jgi:Zn-dependent alcohol dehydrogenase
MTISDTALDTSIWSDIRTKIVGAALAITSQAGLVSSASVNSSYNDKSGSRPQIIINPVLIDKENDKFGSTNKKSMINIIIDCYAEGTLGIDQLSVGVQNVMDLNDIPGIDLMSMTSDVAFQASAEQKYLLKSLVFSYQRE